MLRIFYDGKVTSHIAEEECVLYRYGPLIDRERKQVDRGLKRKFEERTDPSSNAPWSSLTNDEVAMRVRNLKLKKDREFAEKLRDEREKRRNEVERSELMNALIEQSEEGGKRGRKALFIAEQIELLLGYRLTSEMSASGLLFCQRIFRTNHQGNFFL
mmetsp:Transcript_30190/g.84331  ORF Transcript_30190/g.84331 Transcript_30190/m.84331 type:complete len:158 (+) Transcript_30190:298-771(+)